MELYTLGQNSDITSERQEALEIAEDPDHKSFNARQLILNFKGAHGSGQDLVFPSQREISEAMNDVISDEMVDIFGDGSLNKSHQLVGLTRIIWYMGV